MKSDRCEEVIAAENPDYNCGVAVTLELIGGKWKGVILWHLSHKTLRFSQLKRRLPGITQKMLTQQLRELERDGLVHRQVFAEVPPRVEYSLTETGRTLKPTLEKMCAWGRRFHEERK
ncbi:MAG: transcriptional regulator [Desulfuromonas sp.]|nr:MAG: transcriptional regulator [Desulfuromonas sp.]